MTTERDIIEQKLQAMIRQRDGYQAQFDNIMEQLIMTRGAVQILQQTLQEIDTASMSSNEPKDNT